MPPKKANKDKKEEEKRVGSDEKLKSRWLQPGSKYYISWCDKSSQGKSIFRLSTINVLFLV